MAQQQVSRGREIILAIMRRSGQSSGLGRTWRKLLKAFQPDDPLKVSNIRRAKSRPIASTSTCENRLAYSRNDHETSG